MTSAAGLFALYRELSAADKKAAFGLALYSCSTRAIDTDIAEFRAAINLAEPEVVNGFLALCGSKSRVPA